MPPEPSDSLNGFSTHLTVGSILRRARVEKNLTIYDVETAIRVSAQHLQAIEEGRLDRLPGRVYALGFIRSYAEHVGLDGTKMMELLKKQSSEQIAPKDITLQYSPISEQASIPSLRSFAIIVCLLIFAFILQSVFWPQTHTLSRDIPPVPKDLIAQTTLSNKSPESNDKSDLIGPEKPSIPLPASPSNNQIVLKAVDNVWLEIRDSQRKTVFSRVLQVGEEYWINPSYTDLVMTLGNAGGLQISVGGDALPFLGKTGQVIRKVELNSKKMRQILKKSPN